jgi:hypothetical protein
MWTEVFDDDAPAVVWLFSGTTNDVADFERWLASLERLDGATAHRPAVGLLIIDDGNPPPPPAVRDRLAGVARAIRGTAPLAVVTSSSIARTVIAGLHFARVVAFPLKGFLDVDDAVSWLAQQRPPQQRAHLLDLVAEARARAARGARPSSPSSSSSSSA